MYKPLFVLLCLALLAGCSSSVSKSSTSSGTTPQTVTNSVNTSDSGAPANLSAVNAALGDVYGVPEATAMVMRREPDDLYLDDELTGFLERLPSTDPRLESMLGAIDLALKGQGFKATETKPQNPKSVVTKFVKYTSGSSYCTLEVRTIGSTGNSDLAIGCK